MCETRLDYLDYFFIHLPSVCDVLVFLATEFLLDYTFIHLPWGDAPVFLVTETYLDYTGIYLFR